MDDNTKRGGTVPDAGACAPLMPLPTPSSPFGAFGNPLDALRQQAFSLRDMSYRQQGPPMERLKARQKDLEQERAQLTDKLNKIDAAIKLLEAQPELAKTLDALADVGVL